VRFSEKYIDHFSNPRGIGEIEAPDLTAEAAHEGGGCFDKVRLTIKTSGDMIVEARFRARACSGTIASCSALVEMVANISLSEAREMTPEALAEYLGGIPDKKRHSVELAIRALKTAIGANLSPESINSNGMT